MVRHIVKKAWLHREPLRKRSNAKSFSWEKPDFDSRVEVAMCTEWHTAISGYGDWYMLKLSKIGAGKKTPGAAAAKDADLEKSHPAIYTMMAATVDDDGKPRQTSTLTIVMEDGLVKGGLKDRDRNASIWRSSKSLKGLFDALEGALMSGEADWREIGEKSRK